MGTTRYDNPGATGQHEGGSALAEQTEAVTGQNAETIGDEALVVTVRDDVRVRPLRARRWVADNIATATILNTPTKILSANPQRRRLVLQTAGGGVIRIGPSEQTVNFQLPNNAQTVIEADGEVWASATAGGFNLFWYAEFDD